MFFVFLIRFILIFLSVSLSLKRWDFLRFFYASKFLYSSYSLMKPVYNAIEYLDPEKVYTYSNQINNDINLEVYIQINSEKFVDYQKEIFEEFVADFVDRMQDTVLTSKEVEEMLESQLQELNAKLQAFADKLRDVPKCELKWYVQLILDNNVKTWMIGKTSMLIFRDDKMYSVLENTYKEQANIDQFSDFIGWELERWDALLYAGTKLSEILDQNDLNDLEWVLEKENAWAMLDFLDDLFWNRVDKKEIWFISTFSITGVEISSPRSKWKLGAMASKYTSKITGKFSSKIDIMKRKKQTSKVLNGNKYYVMVGFLILAILFLVAAIFQQVRTVQNNKVQYQTSTWSLVDLTLDDIKKDIFAFKTLDPTSDEKSEKYNEILSKISAIESKWVWVEDVAKLKNDLLQEYEEWFMIVTIKNLSQFDDERIGKKTKLLTFNASEKTSLGAPVSIAADASINVAWEKSALIGVINDTTRGTLVEYNLWDSAKACTLSLSKKWMFCYTNKLGVEVMEVIDSDWTTKNIWGIGTYGTNKFYVFQKNPNNMANALLTRYSVVAGSENKYQQPSTYSIVAGSWVILPQELHWFAIDGNFLAWWDWNLYQFWRSSAAGTTLEMRTIDMIGWDKTTLNPYSNNVKVLAWDNSPYIFLFDKDNQTFTVYESSPAKTNQNYTTNFKLYYLFRFKFALWDEEIIDAAVPSSTADRPELYLLSTNGVNKINLYEFIDRVKENKNIKSINDAE